MSNRKLRTRALWLSLLCLTSLGCDKETVEVVPVTGSITLNGLPLADATVTFVSQNGHRSEGRTLDDGSYELTYLDNLKGAVPGQHTVFISTLIEADPDATDPLKKSGRAELVPEKYNSATTLHVEVIRTQREPIDFLLEGNVPEK